MSQHVVIDYVTASLKLIAFCEKAEEDIKKEERTLQTIEKPYEELLALPEFKEMQDRLLEEKKAIINEIRKLKEEANSKREKGKKTVEIPYFNSKSYLYNDYNDYNTFENFSKEKMESLGKKVNNFADKIVEYSVVLEETYKKSEYLKKVRKAEFMKKLESIEDGGLRQYIYLASFEHKDVSFEELYRIAILKKEEAEKKKYELIEEERMKDIKEELKKAGIDDEEIDQLEVDKTLSAKERIQKFSEAASNEIVAEKVRKETVRIIKVAIERRDFTISSTKIDRKKNEVIIKAKKPSGANVEFKVFLDGKFEYCFDGYKGQACQEDIAPFMNDLEEIYGIKVSKSKELWRANPDKLDSMKLKYLNVNKQK